MSRISALKLSTAAVPVAVHIIAVVLAIAPHCVGGIRLIIIVCGVGIAIVHISIIRVVVIAGREVAA
jgi:succinate dehydrogenase/fumarate reductase cytochrome b subunit